MTARSKKATSHAAQGRAADLANMVERTEETAPGIMELLEVYGGYEDGLRMAQEYLAITHSVPVITVNNRSE